MAQSLSEVYRIAAREWAELNAQAELLKGLKDANFSQMKMMHGDMPSYKSDMLVKASPQWTEYIEGMVEAQRKANLKWADCEELKMRHSEQMSFEANNRSERRL
jgi:hypothetical protein